MIFSSQSDMTTRTRLTGPESPLPQRRRTYPGVKRWLVALAVGLSSGMVLPSCQSVLGNSIRIGTRDFVLGLFSPDTLTGLLSSEDAADEE